MQDHHIPPWAASEERSSPPGNVLKSWPKDWSRPLCTFTKAAAWKIFSWLPLLVSPQSPKQEFIFLLPLPLPGMAGWKPLHTGSAVPGTSGLAYPDLVPGCRTRWWKHHGVAQRCCLSCPAARKQGLAQTVPQAQFRGGLQNRELLHHPRRDAAELALLAVPFHALLAVRAARWGKEALCREGWHIPSSLCASLAQTLRCTTPHSCNSSVHI